MVEGIGYLTRLNLAATMDQQVDIRAFYSPSPRLSSLICKIKIMKVTSPQNSVVMK